MSRRLHLASVVSVALLLAACGSDSDTASSDASPTSTAIAATGTVVAAAGDATSGTTDPSGDDDGNETTAPDTTATTPDTSTTTPTTVVANLADCVPGTWELRAQAFFDQIVAFAGGGEGATMTHLGGRHLAILDADGTAEGIRESWSFEVASPAGSLITTVDATDTGTWAVDGDIITMESQEQTFEASFEMLVGGVRQPLPVAPPNAVEADAFGGAGPYTCEGDILTITLTENGFTVTNTWDRIAG